MNYHRWSSLLRGYDISLRYNQLILALSAAGAMAGYFISGQEPWSRLFAAVVAGVSGGEKNAPRTQHTSKVGRGRILIRYVVEHVVRQNHIHRFIRQGEMLHIQIDAGHIGRQATEHSQ